MRHRYHCRWLFLWFVLAAGFVVVRPAFAHKLKVFASAEGTKITGYAYFPGGGRASDLPVVIRGPGGQTLGKTRTDEEGRFEFQATRRCDHLIFVKTGTGHAASFTVSSGELSRDLPEVGERATQETETFQQIAEVPSHAKEGKNTRAVVERAVNRQIRPLREELDAYHSRARLHEVIGGIGYIVGITGLIFFLRGRRSS